MRDNNIYASSIYEEYDLGRHSEVGRVPPDIVHDFRDPPPDFVLCRDSSGKATAIYGENVWDFDPYALSITRSHFVNFNNISEGSHAQIQIMRSEAKRILFCLIYFTSGGRLGRISATTVQSFYNSIVKAAKFCATLNDNQFSDGATLKDLYGNPSYLALFIRSISKSAMYLKSTAAILGRLQQLEVAKLGFKVCSEIDIKPDRSHNQHPVIPSRIYLEIVNYWHSLMEHIAGKESELTAFIKNFKDPVYGYSHKKQKTIRGVSKKDFRPDVKEGILAHGLNDLFDGPLSAANRIQFVSALTKMQYVVLNIVQLYTGMRFGEAIRLHYGCLENVNVPSGSEAPGAKNKVVSIISTTTKFTGFRSECAWLAGEPVVQAVRMAEAIVVGLAHVLGRNVESTPLFLNPNFLTLKSAREVIPFNKKTVEGVRPKIIISRKDLDELVAGDPERDFMSEAAFSIGTEWPLTSHQYRRSLSFYASNSGFVSLPTLQTQYKHTTREMAKYYQRGFQNIASVFGFYDEEMDDFVLPSDHFANEFQTGVPINKAHQILVDVLGSESRLFGGTGSYMEKQRLAANEGVSILTRKETERLVREGSISYKVTLLGGCTKVEPCDSYILGELFECLSCPGSVIHPDKVATEIQKTESELSNYDTDSGEYQVVNAELDRLKKYQDKNIIIHEVLE
ncbi:hypothetical protein CZ787_00330 [Halomonas citrativorans]|uniref:Integrase n=1 Tax=Halomonas citrativorans TaxID=2742612 RepID=A0A1R4HNH6_9GAMM|nr:hypothetical protein [Halomonas citrativorans]SJN08914.1 hypothetical protein CZ787_00330 [Halomonas citrativorans]